MTGVWSSPEVVAALIGTGGLTAFRLLQYARRKPNAFDKAYDRVLWIAVTLCVGGEVVAIFAPDSLAVKLMISAGSAGGVIFIALLALRWLFPID